MSIEEAAFWADCPDVETDPDKMGGTPTVGPYRLAAETVVYCGEDGLTPEEIVEIYPGTPVDKVASILNYYLAHQPELTPAR